MQARTFAEVLDTALGGVTTGLAAERPPAAGFTYQPANPFLFFAPPAPAWQRMETTRFGEAPRRTPEPSTGPSTGSPTDAHTTGASAEPKERWSHARRHSPAVPPISAPRTARVLTGAQQRAFDVLIAFQAKLTADFTAKDLRREYRLLALRLHPDRHQALTEAERALLSRRFADASASYRCLLLSVEPRH